MKKSTQAGLSRHCRTKRYRLDWGKVCAVALIVLCVVALFVFESNGGPTYDIRSTEVEK